MSEPGLASAHLRLAGITCLGLSHPSERPGPQWVFVFDPHRLALPCWRLAMEEHPGPATLLTFDRHLDLVEPRTKPPARSAPLRAFDEYCRYDLDVKNVDHILAAAGSGLIGDVVAIARTRIPGAVTEPWKDGEGRTHAISVQPTFERWLNQHGRAPLEGQLILDFDLDCFTSQGDADPTEILPWPEEMIARFLLPEGAEAFWRDAWPRTVGITIAREPAHCGGLLATQRLMEAFCRVLFQRMLGLDLP